VAYLFIARNVEPGKEPLLGNGCVTSNNGVTVGSGVFCSFVQRLYDEDQQPLRESPEAAVERVGGWCEMASSLRGREPGSRGTSAVGSRYQAAQ
jgi:hypothetical protein